MMGFELTVGDWLLTCLVGILVGLDAVSWPQAMWSRPIAAGTFGGWLFGAPAEGFLVGAWLEIVLSRHPPFGGARYPETGPAALTAGAAYGLAQGRGLGSLLAAVLVGWAIGWIGMRSVAVLRRFNEKLVARPAALAGSPGRIALRHRLAIGADAIRAGLLVGALLVPSVLFVRFFDSFDAAGRGSSLSPVLAVVALAGLTGVGARALQGRRRGWRVLLAGGVTGAALVLAGAV